MDRPKPICLLNFFEVGGITINSLWPNEGRYLVIIEGDVLSYLHKNPSCGYSSEVLLPRALFNECLQLYMFYREISKTRIVFLPKKIDVSPF